MAVDENSLINQAEKVSSQYISFLDTEISSTVPLNNPSVVFLIQAVNILFQF